MKYPTIAACLLLVTVLGPLVAASEPAPVLQVQVQADKTTCALDDEIVLEVKLLNSGRDPLMVIGRLLWGIRGGLILTVTDPSGKEIRPRVLDTTSLVPSWLDDPREYVVLRQDHFIGTKRRIVARELADTAGSVRLRVSYRSPVPSRYAPDPILWGPEKPVIDSNAVDVKVVE